ncbi:MAG: amino acid adenylation protein, partial [Ruminococcus sp.]|nr:amino acid adenylation protein [Ruminococcus sp.]
MKAVDKMITDIIKQLEKTAARFPDKVMFCDEGGGLTFSQVRDKAKSLASALLPMTQGRKPVAVMSSRCSLTP